MIKLGDILMSPKWIQQGLTQILIVTHIINEEVCYAKDPNMMTYHVMVNEDIKVIGSINNTH